MTFHPGLLNHGAATSHAPAPRPFAPGAWGHPTLARDPRCSRRAVGRHLRTGPGRVTSLRCHSVGLLLLLSLQPRADLACVSSPRGRLGFPAGGWGASGPVGRAASQPSRDGVKEGGRSILASLLLFFAVIIAINIITMYFFKRSGMSHAAQGWGGCGSGQGPSRAGVLCSEVRDTGLAVTGFSPGCSAGPE